MFSGKRIFVLGGSGGIGKEIVSCFRNYGGTVDAPGHSELDLGNEKNIDSYFQCHPKNYDVLVYAAGINNPESFENLTAQAISNILEVNTLGFITVCRHLVPEMRKNGGHILAISSLYGVISRKKRLPYALSKHALIGVIQTLALELAEAGILVNAISPGFIETEMTHKNNSPEKIAELVSNIPLKRLGHGKDIGETAAFLCSGKNRYITGQNIIVDGGYMAGGWQNE